MVDRQFMQHGDLAQFVRVLGGAQLASIDRLAGGSKKGVYRLMLDDGSSVVLYAWNAAENYWTDNSTDPRDPFAEASGLDLLEAATQALTEAGARAPALLLVDRSQSIYPADIAIVEDLRGGTLESMIARDARAAAAPLRAVGAMLNGMAGHTSPKLGKVAAVAAGVAPQDRRPEQIVFEQGLAHLATVAGKVLELGRARQRIEEVLRELHARVQPRDRYSLVHGELGADHVMLDGEGRPVIIDIEGVMFFDVEWEHEFTRMRFGQSYEALGIEVELDPARMALYELARSLSLVEGPLRILETDFPHRDFMRSIVTVHTAKVLRLCGAAS